jgi:hypothetical protein
VVKGKRRKQLITVVEVEAGIAEAQAMESTLFLVNLDPRQKLFELFGLIRGENRLAVGADFEPRGRLH